MFKKSYVFLVISFLALLYNAIQLIFFPELTSMWFMRVIGGLFLLYALGSGLDIYNLYLKNRIKDLDEKIANQNSVNER